MPTLLTGTLLFAAAAALAPPSGAAQPADCNQPAADASRIAVAGGSLTEIIYALGAEERIIAADRTSNYPKEALALPQIGYVRNLSAEGVLSLKPTLVLGEHDMGPPEVVEQLSRVGIDIVAVPEAFNLDGIIAKVRCVGRVLAMDAEADALIERELSPLESVIDAQAAAPQKVNGLVLLGLRQGAPVAAGRDTSGDGLLAMAGARNVMSAFEGWKPVSLEAMAQAAPEVIVVPERGVADAGGLDALLEHPALRLTPAAANRRVVVMDGMAMLGFGLRTATAATDLHRILQGKTPTMSQAVGGP